MAEQIPFSIVENVLSSLGSSVVQKLGSMYGVQKELKKLGETLGTLKAILLDAEEQLEKSYAVKDWVKRMKEVVYDVDDLLDEFATYRLRRGGPVRKVSHFFSSSNQVAFRFQISGRIDDIKEALDDIKKDIFLLNAVPRSTIHPRGKIIGRQTHSSPSTSISLGQRTVKKEEIIDLLVSPNNENVFIVAIVGIGGLGKTTLAQFVFNDDRVKKRFEPRRWVCVSDDDSVEGFGENMLLKKMAKSKDSQSLSLDDLKNEFHNEISQKIYLLALDDVWNNQSENWERVRTLLKVGARGSKILVTTRNTEVSFMGSNTVPIKLEGLDIDESWRLFSDVTFGGQENTVNPAIIRVGGEIVNMCNGVPLIINTLGRTLMQFQSDLSKWLSIQKNENLLSLPYGNDNVLRVLKLSYDNLPTHLKQCFTYCALFPKDYEIEKKSLVQLWIAQGYIQSPNRNELLEDVGDLYFKELLSSSLLEEVKKDDFNNIFSCKMHDLIHDLAQSIVGSEILVVRNDLSNISREARHIALLFEMKAIMETKAMVGKPIRSFLNLYPNVLEDATILNSFLPSVRSLRVLRLDDFNIKSVPKCLGKLSHLRYLDLSNNHFETLPNSISRLKNLQTLKLQYCKILKKFPKNMRELINLRHLENNGCSGLTHMPHGMGKLTSLQSLPLFVVGNGTGRLRNHKVGSLSELESLHQLRGSLCIKNLQNARDVKLESTRNILKTKEYLESLRLEWEQSEQDMGEDGGKWVMEGLRPNPQLKELFIQGYGAKEFPSWMMNDHELASWLPDLAEQGSFCYLSELYIYECFNLESLHFPPSLSKLEIRNCNKLASLKPPSSSSLSKLEIHNCSNLASLELPSSSPLSELVINNCTNLASLFPN